MNKVSRLKIDAYSASEKIILIALLSCPILRNDHVYRLLQINGKNQRRTARKCLQRLKDNGLVIHDIISKGRPLGSVSLWYLSKKGYRIALNLQSFPKTIPAKTTLRHAQLEHDLLIADIFCDLFVCESLGKTENMLGSIHWYPQHQNIVRFESFRVFQKSAYKESHFAPDAVIESGDGKLKIFLEVDRGTKSLSQEQEKLKSFADYFLETHAAKGKNFLIIYSVPSKERGEAIQSCYPESLHAALLPQFTFYEHSQTGLALRQIREVHDAKQNS